MAAGAAPAAEAVAAEVEAEGTAAVALQTCEAASAPVGLQAPVTGTHSTHQHAGDVMALLTESLGLWSPDPPAALFDAHASFNGTASDMISSSVLQCGLRWLLCCTDEQTSLPAIHMLCCAPELQPATKITSELAAMNAVIISIIVSASFHSSETVLKP